LCELGKEFAAATAADGETEIQFELFLERAMQRCDQHHRLCERDPFGHERLFDVWETGVFRGHIADISEGDGENRLDEASDALYRCKARDFVCSKQQSVAE